MSLVIIELQKSFTITAYPLFKMSYVAESRLKAVLQFIQSATMNALFILIQTGFKIDKIKLKTSTKYCKWKKTEMDSKNFLHWSKDVRILMRNTMLNRCARDAIIKLEGQSLLGCASTRIGCTTLEGSVRVAILVNIWRYSLKFFISLILDNQKTVE